MPRGVDSGSDPRRVPPRPSGGSAHRETGVEYNARIGKPIPEGFRVSDDGTHYTDDKGMTIHPESPEEMAYRRRKAEGYY
jgi:hypothetical protein